LKLLKVLRFITSHPLNEGRRFRAILKFIRYQISARLLASRLLLYWVNETRILLSRGEAGLTGNLYCGLMEYKDMSFLAHYLRSSDVFYDIGANVGAYTILASGVIRAKSISFEPLPSTFERLIDQIMINRIHHLVQPENLGLGDKRAIIEFTNDLNCMNRVNLDPANKSVTKVQVTTLDEYCAPELNSLVKIDVEGYEKFILDGGRRFFSNSNVSALIIELNGSGESFGVHDEEVHNAVTSFGFQPVSYDPVTREVLRAETYEKGGNTIYVKDLSHVRHRVAIAQPIRIHTAHGIEL
jgi:FkbM family methyltransferase